MTSAKLVALNAMGSSFLILSSSAFADTSSTVGVGSDLPTITVPDIIFSLNNFWVLFSFVLVILMQPGFAFLEAGLVRSTNVINVLFKNVIDLAAGGILGSSGSQGTLS